MIIIINGSLGVGKTEVSWELLGKFDKGFMLDGDHIGATHPFEIYDNERLDYLYKTMYHLIKFHISNGYENFVINYVFEEPEQLALLQEQLSDLNQEIHCYWLTCDDTNVQVERIKKRNREGLDWELKRFLELQKIQEEANGVGFIGKRVKTEDKSVGKVAEVIWGDVERTSVSDI